MMFRYFELDEFVLVFLQDGVETAFQSEGAFFAFADGASADRAGAVGGIEEHAVAKGE